MVGSELMSSHQHLVLLLALVIVKLLSNAGGVLSPAKAHRVSSAKAAEPVWATGLVVEKGRGLATVEQGLHEVHTGPRHLCMQLASLLLCRWR